MQKSQGSIFINYRKDDTNWNALALYNELQKYFNQEQLFKDFNAIQPGDDFVESINGALQTCDVLLVLIGKDWLQEKDSSGRRRLEDPNDFVRLEIAKALERNIKVIPVMLDNTPMPHEEELPENLRSLSRRQFVEIDPKRFNDDVYHLAEAIRRILKACGYSDATTSTAPYQQSGANPLTANVSHHIEPSRPIAQRPAQPTVRQQFQQPLNTSGQPARPDDHKGLATIALINPPLGIIALSKSGKVNALYDQGKFVEARKASVDAKGLAIVGICTCWIFWIIIAILGQL